jgi:tetratricopeptide (TPR) repeat protein
MEAEEHECPEWRLASFYLGEAYANLGKVHLRLNMLTEAEQELSCALEQHPDYADLHLNLGAVYYKRGRYAKADESIRTALYINPRFARALIYRGLTLLRTGNENGLADVAAAVVLEPAYDDERYERSIAFYRDGDIEQALIGFEEIADTDLDQIRTLLERGVQMLENHAYVEALDALIEAVAICPHYADLRHYLGICYTHREMTDQAIQEFRKAIEINPSFVVARMSLATAYLKIGQTGLAVAELQAVLQIDPDYVAARQLLNSLLRNS